jgi:hypothetical protein
MNANNEKKEEKIQANEKKKKIVLHFKLINISNNEYMIKK